MSYLAGRTKTRIYGIFTIWILLLHIDVIFAALFLDQKIIFEKTHLLKNEYIQERFFTFSAWWILPLIEGIKILVAAGATYLMIWVLPKHLLSRAYRQEIEDEYERKKDKLKKENELEQKKLALAGKQLEVAKTQTDAVTQQEKLTKKEESAWEDDYIEFQKNKIFAEFSQLYESLYTHDGRTYVSDEYGNVMFELPNELIAYVDANELAEVDAGSVKLTEKGRYFMKRYLDEPEETDIDKIKF